jgi:Mlc titration factor MtfA (ptsG expression regulator)
VFGWFQRRSSRKQLLAQPFPAAWEAVLARNVGLAAALPPELGAKLRQITKVLVAERRFEGVAGFTITEEVKVTIAASAALLLLGVDGYFYERLPSIIVRPGQFTRKNQRPNWIEEDQDVLGLAAQHGPISLAWQSVLHNGRHPERGENVVLHEFAHHLDGLDGDMGGSLATGDAARDRQIRDTFAKGYRRHVGAVERGERTLVSPNGAENQAEFFAYSVECFFGQAALLAQQQPELYGALSAYFRLDPASWTTPPSPRASQAHGQGRVCRAQRPGPHGTKVSTLPPLHSADEYFTRGYELWQEGELEQALADFTAALALHPEDAELLEHRAGVLRQLDRFAQAEADCRRALELAPGDSEATRTLGLVLLDQDRFAEALPLLDAAVREFGDTDSLFTRGQARAALSDWAGAEADFAAVLRKDPGDDEAEEWLAQCRLKRDAS